MYIARGNRRIGRWSALLAAYAFVLNALLATTLLAATPPAKSLSGFELCAASADTTSQLDHTDKTTKRAAVHCQICLQHAAPTALPAPSIVALPVPIAGAITFAAFRANAPGLARPFSNFSPRGPPHLN
jgi:Protein of unknown function (DUF2946)